MSVANVRLCAWALAVALAVCGWAGRSRACVGYEQLVPLSAVPAERQCLTCHTGPSGGDRNVFGAAWCSACLSTATAPVNCAATVVNPGLCNEGVRIAWTGTSCEAALGSLDSDGDGFTNDEEFQIGSSPGDATTGDDECALNPCDAKATRCKDPNLLVRGDVQCTCPKGYQGDGLKQGTGCKDIDECAAGTDDCTDPNSQCVNTDGSFNCPCAAGYLGSGHDNAGCTMQNFCDGDPPCSPLATCFPKLGGFDCRACSANFIGNESECAACPPGYTGDGVGASGCTDVDECAVANDCATSVTCDNRIGGRICEACPPGYTGSAVGPDGCTKDACAACSPYASCDPQRNPPCVCNPGYTDAAGTSGGISCTDVDECKASAKCPSNTTCRNLPGGYQCVCNAGYSPQGDECVATSCASWGQDCGAAGHCADSKGSPQCVCNDGSSGSYPACVADKALQLKLTAAPPGLAPQVSEASASGCTFASSGRQRSPFWLAAGLLLGLAARRSRARRRSNIGSEQAGQRAKLARHVLLCLLAAVLAACSSDRKSGPSASVSQSGAGGASASTNAGGGSSGAAPDLGNTNTGLPDAGTAGGAGGSTDALTGGPPTSFTCHQSRECAVDEWCNPATSACVSRTVSSEHLTFRTDVYDVLKSSGCPVCHTPGGRGDLDPSGQGAHVLFDDPQRAYLSLTAGGLTCQSEKRRLCVDDPAASRLILQVMAGQGTSQESVAFTDWNDAKLQTILRWIASGASRDRLCGNFQVDTGEACDEGPNPPQRCPYGVASCTLCNSDCQLVQAGPGPSCGDGVLDVAHETCDPASPDAGVFGNVVCGSDCTYVAR